MAEDSSSGPSQGPGPGPRLRGSCTYLSRFCHGGWLQSAPCASFSLNSPSDGSQPRRSRNHSRRHSRRHFPSRMHVSGRTCSFGASAVGRSGETLFEARHVDLGNGVAIKLMRVSTNSEASAARRSRFARGAPPAPIAHPNVVKVLDTGIHEGVPYLVMELLEGEDLGSLLAREGNLGAARIAEILMPVIAGVAAAHRAGIVHRDVKPSNIVLARRHRNIEPVVVDFGISQSIQASVETKASTQGAGSVLYMAPEQLRAQPVTAKADQYALGVILYECVTGGHPFYEADHYALMNAIMTADVVPPSELAPGLSDAFDALVLRRLVRATRRTVSTTSSSSAKRSSRSPTRPPARRGRTSSRRSAALSVGRCAGSRARRGRRRRAPGRCGRSSDGLPASSSSRSRSRRSRASSSTKGRRRLRARQTSPRTRPRLRTPSTRGRRSRDRAT